MCLESSSVEKGKIISIFSLTDLRFKFRLCVAFFLFYHKSKGHDLQDALDRKDHSESSVKVLQYGLICRRGRVILKRERQLGLNSKKCVGVSGVKKWNIP